MTKHVKLFATVAGGAVGAVGLCQRPAAAGAGGGRARRQKHTEAPAEEARSRR